MLKYIIPTVIAGFLLLLASTATAQEHYIPRSERYRDSLRQHISQVGSVKMNYNLSYRVGSSVIDEALGENSAQLQRLRRFLEAALHDTLMVVSNVSLNGYCSPEGSTQFNDQLAYNRAHGLKRHLRTKYASINRYSMRVNSHGADWQGLHALLAQREMPSPLYQLYPLLRRVKMEIKVGYDLSRTRAKLKSYVRPPVFETMEAPLPLLTWQPLNHKARKARKAPVDPLFALKTNLLFDAVLAPNVELEVPIGKRWSVMGEYTFPWWLKRDDSWCYEMLQFGAEGRYWWGDRERLKNGKRRNLLTGYFVGAYAGGGYYDFQFQRNFGYQGEFYIAAGVSGGYALRLARRLNLEFSLGVGWLATRYRSYDVERTAGKAELVRNSYGRFQWLGPTKAKVSLVWLLGSRKGGGKR